MDDIPTLTDLVAEDETAFAAMGGGEPSLRLGN